MIGVNLLGKGIQAGVKRLGNSKARREAIKLARGAGFSTKRAFSSAGKSVILRNAGMGAALVGLAGANTGVFSSDVGVLEGAFKGALVGATIGGAIGFRSAGMPKGFVGSLKSKQAQKRLQAESRKRINRAPPPTPVTQAPTPVAAPTTSASTTSAPIDLSEVPPPF